MKSFKWMVFLLISACGGSQNVPFPAQIPGTNALVQVGNYLFVTATDEDELRVLDLLVNPRDFVRAPNPVEPLSIPVVDLPIALVRDIRYEQGNEVAGPNVYALGSASPQVSIVSANPEVPTSLRELGRATVSGTVTAASARGPAGGTGPSTLYIASFEGGRGIVWQQSIPPVDENGVLPALPAPTQLFTLNAGETVISMVTLPASNNIAIAARSLSGSRSFTLDTATLALQTTLQFPGPVRLLTTHAKGGEYEAGQRIFGVLDESGCGNAECRGVVAVESGTGTFSNDITGNPMLPLFGETGLVMGFTIAANARVQVPGRDPSLVDVPLLGVFTSSTGKIFFFDAGELRHIDADPAGPTLTLAEPTKDFNPDAGTLVAADGAARDEQVNIVYQGLLEGLVGLSTKDVVGPRFPVPASLVGRVEVGDSIEVHGPGECGGVSLTVASKEAAALIANSSVPAGCQAQSFDVRAVAVPSYVVSGTVTGYMGRIERSTVPFRFVGAYFHHPNGFKASSPPPPPQLEFVFNPTVTVQRGERAILTSESHFKPLWLTVSASSTATVGTFSVPGAVVFAGALDRQALNLDCQGERIRQFIYVAYPSAESVVQVTPECFSANQANSRNVISFR